MANCAICGKSLGWFRSKCAACSGIVSATVTETRVEATDITAEFFADRSEKMGRPYELEADRINNVVERVKALKRSGDYNEALEALSSEIEIQEKDIAAGLGGVAPWYYEQAAIVYRKLEQFDDEIAVLERFARQQHAPGASPPKLLQRLEMARWHKDQRNGIDSPKPTFKSEENVEIKKVSKDRPVKIVDDQPPISDFIALDVETANADSASICSIGLVHFKGGEVIKSLTILVDPQDEFDPINISIHGITPEMVVGKPTMAKVFPVIAPFLTDVVVVHHSPIDKTAIKRAAAKYGTDSLDCIWLDTLRVARRAWPWFSEDGKGYGLARLADEFSIEFRHHDAAEDARAAGLVLLKAEAHSGLGIIDWLKRVEQPISGNGGSFARTGDPAGLLAGEVVVFTGKLELPREDASTLAAKAGCEVADGVNERTTLLVVGEQNLRATKGQDKSSKHRKAERLISDGQSLRIVGENDFLRMVSAD